MSNFYTCPICNSNFNDQSAHCEDWSVPHKSFGCPECKIFLQLIYIPVQGWKKYYLLISPPLCSLYVIYYPDLHSGNRIASVILLVNLMLALTLSTVIGWSLKKTYKLTPYE